MGTPPTIYHDDDLHGICLILPSVQPPSTGTVLHHEGLNSYSSHHSSPHPLTPTTKVLLSLPLCLLLSSAFAANLSDNFCTNVKSGKVTLLPFAFTSPVAGEGQVLLQDGVHQRRGEPRRLQRHLLPEEQEDQVLEAGVQGDQRPGFLKVNSCLRSKINIFFITS